MKSRKFSASIMAGIALLVAGFTSNAFAQDIVERAFNPTEFSIMGGFQQLNKNDSGVPDGVHTFPAIAALSYRVNDFFAFEGELTWMVPVKQRMQIGPIETQDLRNPSMLAYQANLRASRPVDRWTPYVIGGVGAVTFLANKGQEERFPFLNESQTTFGANAGVGLMYDFNSRWAARGDLRALAAFPKDGTPGLSGRDGKADPIVTERATVGVSYRF